MQTHTLFSLLLLLTIASSEAISQTPVTSPDQNPNASRSLERYLGGRDSLLRNQGETVQETYTAIQPWYDAWNARQQWKSERGAFRRQLRLERARRPILQQGWYPGNRFTPMVQPWFGWSGFNRDWRWDYGFHTGFWPW